MFEKSALLFIYVETPLHAGTGRGLGAVDLPIQRERVTQYPMIQASSLKGKLRAEVRLRNNWQDDSPEITALFGKAGDADNTFSGAVAPGDARVLLFPVRSLAGVLAWTTSLHVLQRFARDCAFANLTPPLLLRTSPGAGEAFVTSDAVKAGDYVVLEDFSFKPISEHSKSLRELAQWVVDRALPNTHAYWRKQIVDKLVVLPEDAFRDFALYATEVQTHVRLDPARKTVQPGALWTTESLPPDTLLYAPLMVSQSRVDSKTWNADNVLTKLKEVLGDKRVQLGGDETAGQGWVTVRLVEASANGGQR